MKRKALLLLIACTLVGCQAKPNDVARVTSSLESVDEIPEDTGEVAELTDDDKYLDNFEYNNLINKLEDYEGISVMYNAPTEVTEDDVIKYVESQLATYAKENPEVADITSLEQVDDEYCKTVMGYTSKNNMMNAMTGELYTLLAMTDEESKKIAVGETIIPIGFSTSIPQEYITAKIDEYIEICRRMLSDPSDDEELLSTYGFETYADFEIDAINKITNAVDEEFYYLTVANKESLGVDDGYEEYIQGIARKYGFSVEKLYEVFTTSFGEGETYWERSYIASKMQEKIMNAVEFENMNDGSYTMSDFIQTIFSE